MQGIVERVTFHNEENGFAVLRIQIKGRRELTTVVGYLPSVSAGEWLVAEGKWVKDRDHGTQLKAVRIKTSSPSSIEGIEKYLGSGMVKGIGPVYAKKMVEKFGEKIFDIIDNQSARLEDIEGIGPGRRKKIKDAWAEQKIVREIMVFLHTNGLSTSRAVRIYKTYGDQSIEKLQENPYVLVRDIHGVGFQTADKLARKMGIPFDSIIRARAGIMHTLNEASGEGHCGLPTELLIQRAVALLDISSERIVEALELDLRDGDVLERQLPNSDSNLLMSPNIYQAEQIVFDHMFDLMRKESTLPKIQVDKAIEWVQEKTGLKLAEQQKLAIEKSIQTRICIITGGPGVGKTTLIKSLIKILNAKKVKTVLCAPTGRAAKRLEETSGMEAKTIHRLLEGRPGGFARNKSNPIEGDLLIVDESSMIDIILMSHLIRALPTSAHLIMVGDVDQLPSVGPGSVLSDLLECKKIPYVRLTEVFRQAAESQIITMAHQINSGQFSELKKSEFSDDFFFIERDEPEKARDTIINLVNKRIPQSFAINSIKDIQVLCPMNKGALGVHEINKKLQESSNPRSKELGYIEKFGNEFRPGDKVIQTQNNYDKDVFNGDIGIIEKLDMADQNLSVKFDDRVVDYEFSELDELQLAYAITIHKSQGSEFPVVIIPISTQHFVMLQRNLVYTGLTRGKTKVVFIGQPKAMQMAVRNGETMNRYSSLKSLLIAKDVN